MNEGTEDLRAIAGNLIEYIGRSAPTLVRLAEELRADEASSASLAELQTLPDTLQTLTEFLQSASMLGYEQESSKILNSILSASKIFVQAQEVKDSSLLADVLEYDLSESFEAIKAMCQRISSGD